MHALERVWEEARTGVSQAHTLDSRPALLHANKKTTPVHALFHCREAGVEAKILL